MAEDVRVFVSFHPMVIAMHAWSERSLRLPWPLHHLHLPSLLPHYPQAVPSILQLPPRLSSKSLVHFAKEMGSTDESFSNTGYEPKDCFHTETFVEFNQEPVTEQRFSEQRFLEDVDYDDAAIGEMLFDAYREQVYHSQREGLSAGQASSSMSDRTGQPVVQTVAKSHDRTGQPVVETGQELNPEHAQIRTLLNRQRAQILADCQAEIGRHKYQADYDRRSIQKIKWNDRIAARRTS